MDILGELKMVSKQAISLWPLGEPAQPVEPQTEEKLSAEVISTINDIIQILYEIHPQIDVFHPFYELPLIFYIAITAPPSLRRKNISP